MSVPVGDQSGWRSPAGLVVSRRTSLPPAFMLKMSNARVAPAAGSTRSLANAIRPLNGAAGADAGRASDAAAAIAVARRTRLRIGRGYRRCDDAGAISVGVPLPALAGPKRFARRAVMATFACEALASNAMAVT